MRLYATADDAWPTANTAPANADQLLRTASRTVETLTVGRTYRTDEDGMPTDTDKLEAMRDAAVAIALECQATGALEAGGTEAYDAVGIGSVSLSGRRTAEGAVIVDGVPVPPAAMVALRTLGPARVWLW